jgi:hypothetical protein
VQVQSLEDAEDVNAEDGATTTDEEPAGQDAVADDVENLSTQLQDEAGLGTLGVPLVPQAFQGAGTEANPLMIMSPEQLVSFRDAVNAGNNTLARSLWGDAAVDNALSPDVALCLPLGATIPSGYTCSDKDAYVKLGVDIDLGGKGSIYQPVDDYGFGGWIPIGGACKQAHSNDDYPVKVFECRDGTPAMTSHFDGGYHVISNIYMNSYTYYTFKDLWCPNGSLSACLGALGVVLSDDWRIFPSSFYIQADRLGFFGMAEAASSDTTKPALVKNFGVKSGYINGTQKVSGVLGQASNITVENVFNTADIVSYSATAGVIGYLDQDSILKNAYNRGTVNCTNTSSCSGVALGVGQVYNTFNTGNTTSGTSGPSGGLFSGYATPFNSYISSSVNLSQLISAAENNDNPRRIFAGGTGANNYAWSGTLLNGNQHYASSTDPTSNNGADTTYAVDANNTNLNSASFWTETVGGDFDDPTIWSVQDEKLPILAGFAAGVQDDEIPSYIKSGLNCYSGYAFDNDIKTGGSTDPFEIANGYQLECLSTLSRIRPGEYSNKNYVLTADIDLDYSPINNASGWLPIQYFTGTFDGRGHTISGMHIDRRDNDTAGDLVGLFQQVKDSAKISNLGIINSDITGGFIVGALVGQVKDNAKIENVYVDADVRSANNPSSIGLIAGSIQGGTIENVHTRGTISSESFNGATGAIVGSVSATSSTTTKIEHTYSTAEVSGANSVGGLFGQVDGANTVNIQDNAFLGKLSAHSANIGRIVGNAINAPDVHDNFAYANMLAGDCTEGFSNSTGDDLLKNGYNILSTDLADSDFWTGNTPESEMNFGTDDWSTATVGRLPTLYVDGTTDLINGQSASGFDAIPGWIGTSMSPFNGGDGSEGDPYQIANNDQLVCLAKFVNQDTNDSSDSVKYSTKSFKLTNDLDLGGAGSSAQGIDSSGFGGWEPIGVHKDFPFNGKFDGGGHSISRIFINKNDSYSAVGRDENVGLFGLADGAVIKNLGINSGSITLNYAVGEAVGSIAGGITDSEVSNVYNNAAINAKKVVEHIAIGGLVGFENGDSSITNSYNMGTVSAVDANDAPNNNIDDGLNMAGGIAGYSTAKIERTWSSGNVINALTGDPTRFAGGIVGAVEGTAFTSIKNNVAVAEKIAPSADPSLDYTARIVGYVDFGGQPTSIVDKNYAYENMLLTTSDAPVPPGDSDIAPGGRHGLSVTARDIYSDLAWLQMFGLLPTTGASSDDRATALSAFNQNWYLPQTDRSLDPSQPIKWLPQLRGFGEVKNAALRQSCSVGNAFAGIACVLNGNRDTTGDVTPNFPNTGTQNGEGGFHLTSFPTSVSLSNHATTLFFKEKIVQPAASTFIVDLEGQEDWTWQDMKWTFKDEQHPNGNICPSWKIKAQTQTGGCEIFPGSGVFIKEYAYDGIEPLAAGDNIVSANDYASQYEISVPGGYGNDFTIHVESDNDERANTDEIVAGQLKPFVVDFLQPADAFEIRGTQAVQGGVGYIYSVKPKLSAIDDSAVFSGDITIYDCITIPGSTDFTPCVTTANPSNPSTDAANAHGTFEDLSSYTTTVDKITLSWPFANNSTEKKFIYTPPEKLESGDNSLITLHAVAFGAGNAATSTLDSAPYNLPVPPMPINEGIPVQFSDLAPVNYNLYMSGTGFWVECPDDTTSGSEVVNRNGTVFAEATTPINCKLVINGPYEGTITLSDDGLYTDGTFSVEPGPYSSFFDGTDTFTFSPDPDANPNADGTALREIPFIYTPGGASDGSGWAVIHGEGTPTPGGENDGETVLGTDLTVGIYATEMFVKQLYPLAGDESDDDDDFYDDDLSVKTPIQGGQTVLFEVETKNRAPWNGTFTLDDGGQGGSFLFGTGGVLNFDYSNNPQKIYYVAPNETIADLVITGTPNSINLTGIPTVDGNPRHFAVTQSLVTITPNNPDNPVVIPPTGAYQPGDDCIGQNGCKALIIKDDHTPGGGSTTVVLEDWVSPVTSQKPAGGLFPEIDNSEPGNEEYCNVEYDITLGKMVAIIDYGSECKIKYVPTQPDWNEGHITITGSDPSSGDIETSTTLAVWATQMRIVCAEIYSDPLNSALYPDGTSTCTKGLVGQYNTYEVQFNGVANGTVVMSDVHDQSTSAGAEVGRFILDGSQANQLQFQVRTLPRSVDYSPSKAGARELMATFAPNTWAPTIAADQAPITGQRTSWNSGTQDWDSIPFDTNRALFGVTIDANSAKIICTPNVIDDGDSSDCQLILSGPYGGVIDIEDLLPEAAAGGGDGVLAGGVFNSLSGSVGAVFSGVDGSDARCVFTYSAALEFPTCKFTYTSVSGALNKIVRLVPTTYPVGTHPADLTDSSYDSTSGITIAGQTLQILASHINVDSPETVHGFDPSDPDTYPNYTVTPTGTWGGILHLSYSCYDSDGAAPSVTITWYASNGSPMSNQTDLSYDAARTDLQMKILVDPEDFVGYCKIVIEGEGEDGYRDLPEENKIIWFEGGDWVGIDGPGDDDGDGVVDGSGTAQPEHTLTLSTSEVAQGETFVVSGEKWYPNEPVHFELHSDPLPFAQTAMADPLGNFSITLTMHSNADVALHDLFAENLDYDAAVEDGGRGQSSLWTAQYKAAPINVTKGADSDDDPYNDYNGHCSNPLYLNRGNCVDNGFVWYPNDLAATGLGLNLGLLLFVLLMTCLLLVNTTSYRRMAQVSPSNSLQKARRQELINKYL